MAKYYESDATKLIRDLIRENPAIDEAKKTGRALWWDKRFTQDEIKRDQESKVEPRPYVYF